MLPENRIPAHPGEVLLEEFLKPLALTQVAFAKHIGVPVQRVNEIVRGKRGVTSDTAWLFGQALNTSPQFWMNLQSLHDLALSRPERPVLPLAQASQGGPMRPILPLAALLAMACGGPPPPDLLLTYEVVPTGTLVDVDAATLDAVPVVKARLDAVGARGIVSAGPDHTLTVRVDGTHADALQASLRAVGSLAIHGVDDGWTELDLRRLAYDADLPPGDVRGLDAWAHAEGRLPADHVLVAQRMPWMDPPPPPLVLFAAPLLTGADLADATASVDELGQPLVSLEFTPTGARRFEAITAAAVGRRLAIVIDGEVESAPTVRAPISGGVAQIQLDPGHDAEDAAGLAVALRTGALPTALRLVASEVVPAEGQPSMP